MLSDWYFCCCLNATPDETANFMSILDVLNDPDANESLLVSTYMELVQAEIWYQGYALTGVLTSINLEAQTERTRAYIIRYFDQIVLSLPKQLQDDFNMLFKHTLSSDVRQYSQKDRVKKIIDCSRAVSNLLAREVSPVPYLDQREFLPETLLFAALLHQLNHDSGFASKLEEYQRKEGDVLDQLVQDALRLKYGRLPFRLAVQIAAKIVSGYDLEDLITNFHHPSLSLVFEPDLLQTFAEICFVEMATRVANTSVGAERNIFEELERFKVLARLVEHSSQSELTRSALDRAGFSISTASIYYMVPLVYWQGVLWEIMTTKNPLEAASLLGNHWTIPGELSSEIEVYPPEGYRAKNTWSNQLTTFIFLRYLKKDVALVSRKSKDFYKVNQKDSWIFYSPWLRKSQGYKRATSYVEGQREEALIRLFAALPSAVHMLQRLPNGAPEFAYLASLVAHGADILDSYQPWLQSLEKRHTEDLTLSLPVSGLAKFTRRKTSLAGKGILPSIDPESFVVLLDERLQNRGLSEMSGDAPHFFREKLPAVLMSWISDAYPGVVDQTGPGRWLPLISRVYKHYKKQSHSFRERLETACLVRFLTSEYRIDNQLADWMHATETVDGPSGRETRPRHWKVFPRQLLLSPSTLLPMDWLQPEWDEPSDWTQDGFNVSTRLVRALERAACLIHGDEHDSRMDTWKSDWIKYLNAVSESKELDRFIRLRVLELLDHKIFQENLEGLVSIAYIILEYGSNYDLKLLLDRVFEAENTSPIISEVKSKLQSIVLQTISNEWRNPLRQVNSEYRTLNDPRFFYIQQQRSSLIENAIYRTAYRVCVDRGNPRLISTLHDLQDSIYSARQKRFLRQALGSIELRGKNGKVILDSDTNHVEEWTIRRAAINTNLMAVALFYEDLNLDPVEYGLANIYNLFSKSRYEVEEIRRLPKNSRITVLAVVMDKSRKNDAFTYNLNCGFDFSFFYTSPTLDFEVGQFIIINLTQTQSSDQSSTLRWQVDSRSALAVRYRRQSGDHETVAVHEVVDIGTGLLSLELRINGQDFEGSKEAYWDANLSRVYRHHQRKLDVRSVPAELDSEGKWHPVDRNLLDLLIALNDMRRNSLQLTFIEEIEGLGGTPSGKNYRFSSRPGENYLILEEQFTVTALERLRDMLQEYGDAKGLLINFKPILSDDSVRLELQQDEIDGVAAFDTRNLRWRNIANSTWIAKNRDGNWFIQLDNEESIPGFPRTISVEWQGGVPRSWQSECEITRWNNDDQRSQRLEARAISVNKIRPENEYKEFYESLLKLKVGDVLLLKTPIKVRRSGTSDETNPFADGEFSCLTNEGLFVRVELESASMLPVDPNQLQALVEDRPSEVSRIRWVAATETPVFDLNSIPSELFDDKEIFGVLVEVPRLNETSEASYCRVVFPILNNRGDYQIYHLQIDNLAAIKPNAGSILYGQRKDTGDWNFTINLHSIHVRALWQVSEVSDLEPDFHYLGEVSYYGRSFRAFESTKSIGMLYLLHTEALPVEPTFLSTWNGSKFVATWRLESRHNNIARLRTWTGADRLPYTRAVINLQNQMLSGKVLANDPRKDFQISSANILLRGNTEYKHLFTLQRTLVVTTIAPSPLPRIESAEVDKHAVWQKTFLEKLDVDLHATLQGQRVIFTNLKVPLDNSFNVWGSELSIASGQGSFLSHPNYPSNAIVRIIPSARASYSVSLRRVPAYTPTEFMNMLEVEFDAAVRLEYGLYYVGRETFNLVDHTLYDEPRYRFEWGYGKTLLVPESQLRYDYQPFDKAQSILYYGDEVIGLSFLEEKTVAPDGTHESTCVINITQASINYSTARSLFTQRHKHKILHFLRIGLANGEVTIMDVEGFDETRMFSSKRSFFSSIQSNLSLRPSDKERLLKRISSQSLDDDGEPSANGVSPKKEMHILGRLDEDAFTSSFGVDLIFEHVQMNFHTERNVSNSADTESGPSPIKSGERLLMQADKIQKLSNDVGLLLKPYSKLNPQDIGMDFREPIKLLRRHFSVREDLLRNVFIGRGEAALENQMYLVRLELKYGQSRSVNKKSSKSTNQPDDILVENYKIISSIREAMPSRNVSALATAINQSKSALLAVVLSFSQTSLNLEVKPGVFVTLSSRDIQFVTPGLVRGDVVNVSRAGGKFKVLRVAFSDSRYVPENDVRGAVALPKNELLDNRVVWDRTDLNQSSTWFNNNFFSIGSFPDITAGFGEYDPDGKNWKNSSADRWITLMEQKHPKIVQLGKAQSRFLIDLPTNNVLAGRLRYDATNYSLSIFPMVSAGLPISVPWNRITFTDLAPKEILQRARKEQWYYHDETTGYWSSSIHRVVNEPVPARSSIFTGPLFFEQSQNELPKLRYSPKNFLAFGYPVDELVNVLNQSSDAHEYTLAGIFRNQSIWVEMCPGRIVEIPLELIYWRTGTIEISLMQVNCDVFAVGDRILLKLGDSQGSSVNRIILEDWIPGPRGAFGDQSVFLPIREVDNKLGSIDLGKGNYEITLPSTLDGLQDSVLALTSDNEIKIGPDILPRSGDVVFLTLDDSGRVCVAGLPNIQPRASYERKEIWAKDPLTDLIIKPSSSDRIEFHLDNLARLINLVGGSLPMTVEYYSPTSGIAYLSRKYDLARSSLPENKVTPAKLLGATPDGYSILLQSGGSILRVPADALISGLPVNHPELVHQAIDRLVAQNTWVWLRQSDDGTCLSGIADELSLEFPIRILDWAASKAQSGFICQAIESRKLYWMPSHRIGWAVLTADELGKFASTRRGNIMVRLVSSRLRTPFVSIVDLSESTNGFNNLKIGSTLSIVRLFERQLPGSSRRYIVESFSTHMILECEIYDGELGENELVEVVQKISSFPYTLRVVPFGKRQYWLDLPTTITNGSSDAGRNRTRFESYLSWRAASCDELPHGVNFGDLPDEVIEEFLCYAFDHPNEKMQDVQFTMNVADQWYQRNLDREELDLHYSLMVIWILYQGSELDPDWLTQNSNFQRGDALSATGRWREKCMRLLHNVGRRTLRSLHIEAISRLLNKNRQREDGLWMRLTSLEKHLRKPANLDDINAILRFCQAASLRNEVEIQALAECLYVATGGVSKWKYTTSYVPILSSVLRVFISSVPTEGSLYPRLTPDQIKGIESMLDQITLQRLHIMLLAPLPMIENSTNGKE